MMPPCIAPWTRARVFDLWQEGQRREARQAWNRMLPLHYWLSHGVAIEAGKLFLMHVGVFETYYMRPDVETAALKQVAPLILEEADQQQMLKALEDMGEPPY